MRRILGIAVVVVLVAGLAVFLVSRRGNGSDGYQLRAIFDNAFTLIKGEDVRVSGVNVGKIKKLEITPDNRAAVIMDITRAGFDDFRQDATCTIRPQGLIGERFVECAMTQPRPAGDKPAPKLRKVADGQPGAGQYLLPVERTSKPVDLDLLNNIQRLPQRQRLSIILNELGAGFAGRSADLNETIRRANPALGATNRVLKLLATQNQTLRALATNSDTVLAPLARDRAKVADFIVQANTVSQATAERRADLERNFQRLPRFLQELKPTMVRLRGFADEFQPTLTDLQAAAPDINRLFRELGPFSQASVPAISSLGDAAVVGRPALIRTRPIIRDLRGLFGEARPLAANLKDLTTSLRDSGGIERLMDYLFFQVAAINGYDSFGHYLRAGLIVNTCTGYTSTPQPGCGSRFQKASSASARAAANSPSNTKKLFSSRARALARAQAAGKDESAAALRKDTKGSSDAGSASSQRSGSRAGALKLPADLLPGQGAAPAPAAKVKLLPQPGQSTGTSTAPSGTGGGGASTQAQDSLLDYLLGSGS